MFSCEYCEIFKNIYFEKHLRNAVSGFKGIQKGEVGRKRSK